MLKRFTNKGLKHIVCLLAGSLILLWPVVSYSQTELEEEVVEAPEIYDIEEESVVEDYYSGFNELEYYDEAIEPRSSSDADWEKAVAGLDYSTSQPRKKKKEPSEPAPVPPGRSLSFGDAGFFQWLFRALLLIGGIAIIVLIVRSMIQMKAVPKDQRFDTQSIENLDLQHIEENLHTADLDPLLQRAIAQGNYPLAVRLYYLAMLKKLSEGKFVYWKKDKTNRDYLSELSATPLHQPFREATFAFEWVWYGDAPIGASDFERLQVQFKEFLSLISSSAKP